MPELIELSRNELLKEAMRARDERDTVTEYLNQSTADLLKLADKLHDKNRKLDIYFGLMCVFAVAALTLAVLLILRFPHSRVIYLHCW